MFNLDQFISHFVTKRQSSMFMTDIDINRDELCQKIEGKTVLVIGGAGSIGSSFIKAILPFKPSTLVVVDTNENALAELTRDIRSTKNMFIPNILFYNNFVLKHLKIYRNKAIHKMWNYLPLNLI